MSPMMMCPVYRPEPERTPVMESRPQLRAETDKDKITRFFGDFTSTPLAVCPSCKHELTDEEIRKGFSTDPLDFNTTCPKCGTRFFASLIISVDGRVVEQITYFCPDQTLHQMKTIKVERGRIGIVYLGKHDRQLFFNIVRHFRTYNQGLKRLKLLV